MQSPVADLLDVARIESGGFTVDRADVDAAGVMEEMRRMFESAAAVKGIRLEVDASGFLPPLSPTAAASSRSWRTSSAMRYALRTTEVCV